MSLYNSIVKLCLSKNLIHVNQSLKYPQEIQFDVLNKLLKKAKNTKFGKEYNFAEIIKKGPKAFAEEVPLNQYEGLKPYIQEVANGAKDILWPGAPKWFAMSSGTTDDRSKYIPVTEDALQKCHFRGGVDVLAKHLSNFPDTTIFKGKSLVIGGSRQINRMGSDAFCGDLSAILISNLPQWVKMRRTPREEIALLESWEEKLEKMSQQIIKEDVTSVSGVPSWTLVLFKKILEITGKNDISEIWPNLTMFQHGGVEFTPYRAQYQKIISNPKMRYVETYNASEGFFAFQNDPNSLDMLLMLDLGIYYEFIDMEEFFDENRKAIPLSEVKTGVNYAIVISTNGGLWRYIIGDTVEFTSIRPYKIKITGRTKHFINAFGEELVMDNASKSIEYASRVTGADISNYTAAPVYMGDDNKGAHQWLIEFNVQPDDISKFAQALDFKLKQVNSDYEAKRFKDLSLQAPQIIIARPGLFSDWLKSKGKLGGQNKVPRLSNKRDLIDQLLKLNN